MPHDGLNAKRVLRNHLVELTALHERLVKDPTATPPDHEADRRTRRGGARGAREGDD